MPNSGINLKESKNAPTASHVKVIKSIFLVSFTTPPTDSELVLSFIRLLALRLTFFLRTIENKTPILTKPSPPICIKIIITSWPKKLQ